MGANRFIMTPLHEAERLARFMVFILIALGVVVSYRLIRWVRRLPVSPDPWDEQTAQSLDAETTAEICHKCSRPHPPEQPFCEHCGAAIGTYNNCMPYVYLFSEGEVLRTGVAGKFRVNALTVGGYLIYSLISYLIFAPIYWYLLFRNVRRIKAEAALAAGAVR